jgi:hypothetical protein
MINQTITLISLLFRLAVLVIVLFGFNEWKQHDDEQQRGHWYSRTRF